jgi:hypothetical protein
MPPLESLHTRYALPATAVIDRVGRIVGRIFGKFERRDAASAMHSD